MGMRSTFITESIVVKDKEALKKIDVEFAEELIDKETGSVSFEGWDDTKLEGYWYPEQVKILKAIAPYIEGYAEFDYEEGYNFRIIFENGKVYFLAEEKRWDESLKTELN